MADILLSNAEMALLEKSVQLIKSKLAEHRGLFEEIEERIADYDLTEVKCKVCASSCESFCYTKCSDSCKGSCSDSCKSGCQETCHTAYYLPG